MIHILQTLWGLGVRVIQRFLQFSQITTIVCYISALCIRRHHHTEDSHVTHLWRTAEYLKEKHFLNDSKTFKYFRVWGNLIIVSFEYMYYIQRKVYRIGLNWLLKFWVNSKFLDIHKQDLNWYCFLIFTVGIIILTLWGILAIR